MTRVLAFGLLLVAVSASPAASPDPKSLEVPASQVTLARDLVRQLGSDAFRERDAASRKLSDMGREALPALIEGSRDSVDAEVRMRCEVLLPRAESEDMKAKVDVFLADTEGKYTHDLPGWDKFKEICGNEKAARELFADIIKVRDNHELLIATRLPAEEMKQVVDARKRQIQFRMQPVVHTPNFRPRMPTLAEGAALLLVESVAPEREDGWNGGWIYHTQNLFYQGGEFQNAVRGQGKHGVPFRKLAVKWLNTRDGMVGIQTAINLAPTMGLSTGEIAKFHAKLLALENADQWAKLQSIAVLARSKDASYVAAVKNALEDARSVPGATPDGKPITIEVRDVALAAVVQLSGQKLSEYGFTVLGGGGFDLGRFDACRFVDDKSGTAEDKRKKAFEKWAKWETESKQK